MHPNMLKIRFMANFLKSILAKLTHEYQGLDEFKIQVPAVPGSRSGLEWESKPLKLLVSSLGLYPFIQTIYRMSFQIIL